MFGGGKMQGMSSGSYPEGGRKWPEICPFTYGKVDYRLMQIISGFMLPLHFSEGDLVPSL